MAPFLMVTFLMPKNDVWIRRMGARGMVEPFVETLVKKDGVISSGVSSYGYDMRVADEFKIFTAREGVVDPKGLGEDCFTPFKGEVCVIPAGSYALGRSVEYFRIPRDVLAVCFGKSTYARCGIVVNVTPLEPEWEGHVTISISNTSPLPARIYANEGIAQVIFLGVKEACETSYADRAGKYQAQREITLPR